MNEWKLMVLDPGHFHASLLQREMYPDVSPLFSVYAPLGPELVDYLSRVSQFNLRTDKPTRWELAVHTSDHALEHMLHDRPGNVVVLSGRNREKIRQIQRSVEAGFHVLADKPWIIRLEDIPLLETALAAAERKGVVAYDIMTERFEITSLLQRKLVNHAPLFGELLPGTAEHPGIHAMSIHHLMKTVASAPLRRPTWFFDTAEYGEGLADVGTHVVDLVQWTAFPDQELDYRRDVEVVSARHWPTTIQAADYRKVTGADLPGGKQSLDYYCNNAVHYKLRGVNVKLEILWNWEAPAGAGDVYQAAFDGTAARVEIRQHQAEPELFVLPKTAGGFAALDALIAKWKGVSVRRNGDEVQLVIAPELRVSHEAHFAQVASSFFGYLRQPATVPRWERAGMLTKYYITTKAVEMGSEMKPTA